MKKILLIEDNTFRQNIACNKISLDISKYADIVENAIEEKYQIFLQQVEKSEFISDDYMAIMAHKSAFGNKNQQMLSYIESICKKNDMPLVLFSGGMSVSHYTKGDEIEKLLLNTKIFYSNNLRLFLEHFREKNEIELMVLNYGKSWRLNILLNVLEKINFFIAKESAEDVICEEFTNKTGSHLLEKVTDTNEIEKLKSQNGWITLEDIKKYAQTIEKIVEKRILHER